MRQATILVLACLLAGCTAVEPDAREDDATLARPLVQLDAFPEGADWVLYEIRAASEGLFDFSGEMRAAVERDSLTPPPAACRGLVTKYGAALTHLSSGSSVTLRAGGTTVAHESIDVAGTSFSMPLSVKHPIGPTPTPLLLAFTDAAAWAAKGATLTGEVRADVPFEVVSVTYGTMRCHGDLEDWAGDELHLGVAGRDAARDLVLGSEDAAGGWIVMTWMESDLGHQARFVTPAGETWRSDALPGDAERRSTALCCPTRWTHHIDHAQGTTSAGVMAVPLPPWAAAQVEQGIAEWEARQLDARVAPASVH